jgi:zinc protease
MKRTLTALFLCLMLAFGAAVSAQDKPAAAQTPAAKPSGELPTAEQIVNKFVQAIGGKAAVEKLTSREEKGTFELPAMGLSAPIVIYSKAPNKTVFTIDIESIGTVRRGYNGTTGWSEDPQTGLREMSGGELAQMKIGSDFYRDIKLMQVFPKMTVKGVEKVNGSDAYVVDATSAEGLSETFYFDTQTGLLVRSDVEADTPQGKMKITSLPSDYREVDGMKIPFTLRQNTPQGEFVIKLDSVKHNTAIDDAKFNKPAGQ